MANSNLTNAKRAKNDEFYTQYDDIQKEIEAYLEYNPKVFKGKTVYCNCDDPFESNFFRYFVLNFDKLRLKQLITTSYKPSPVANTQLELIGVDKTHTKSKGRPKITANKFIINEVQDIDGDGEFNLKDVAKQLKANKHNEWTPINGDGDFRSDECIKLLKQSDIVVTNPPFSLFREYVKQLFDYNKKFVIIGNLNAITYKEVFQKIKENKMWLGPSISSGDREFQVPDSYPITAAGWRVNDEGKIFLRIKGVRWFTNLDHGRRHQPLKPMSMKDNLRFNKKLKGKEFYDRYDNYDAIEVPFTDAIPSDYKGVMGVPISFLDKYNPDQFEIVGLTSGRDEFECRPSKKYINPTQHNTDGSVINGSKSNTRATIKLDKVPADIYYTADNADGPLLIVYARILIKHKKK
ncbi:MAG: DNA methyltransferase [Candidatus Edwardsbacteria bacterium RIFOXYD12_FULL_50_11]|uniref:DNA methyltransferase n=1 Tax=Candidatus Edwardsbacteria bacterium GWF2_54_11 TaxID=1817851 RepID=A0A1F5RJ18_9BACT|nr:MAG: DNA methyltransferase [Candidatus Edwardsbacteria bacterium RifOxyC12_full_54_24]OGF08538.1 MAG: DNA methyltransferase [Candidatus Edwardsbacteria bacterium RifOxyA12_full_54_48]OGF11398.1 MAG: DNA methyltransferase [Candidatus Edwardsbacteria bacterium GWE2_54_12]OGF14446.1 MAG: DNA methyltransferase [Candidatus Edwardsbacteria bacterium GWF2_54_11]OGF16374.1 MAG: DNA methyltransferase [Candidatus Edwardsbacteria bacterium RIFOXYD12_FULL_50_11]OGJ17996.1 MAG: DNA methyltransferase [Ca